MQIGKSSGAWSISKAPWAFALSLYSSCPVLFLEVPPSPGSKSATHGASWGRTDPVLPSGHETKSLLNSSGPRYKRSRLERQMNRHVLCCVLILVCMAFISAIGKSQAEDF